MVQPTIAYHPTVIFVPLTILTMFPTFDALADAVFIVVPDPGVVNPMTDWVEEPVE
jgi:hypothetical protein